MRRYVTSSETLLRYLRASSHSFRDSWVLGVVLNLVGSFAGALGDNIVRLSFINERRRALETTRPLHRRPLWLLGFFLSVIVNPLLTILSLKFAAAAIVLPFGGMHIFWNVLLVGYLLREKLLVGDICGSLCILVGVCLVISYGPHEVPTYPLASLSSLATQPTFTLYLLAEATCVVICLAASSGSSPSSSSYSSLTLPEFRNLAASGGDAARRFAQTSQSQQQLHLEQSDSGPLADVSLRSHDTSSSSSSRSWGVASESASLFISGAHYPQAAVAAPADEAGEATKSAGPAAALVEAVRLSALDTVQQRVPLWLRRFSVPVLSGMFGGLGNLSAKGLVEVLEAQGLHQSLSSSEFAVCFLATLFFCSLQLLYLNLALLRHEAKLAVPVVNATLIASGSLGGLLLFREYENMSAAQLAVFDLGILLILGGIALLASPPSGAVSKASQPDLFTQPFEELDGTDEERQVFGMVQKYAGRGPLMRVLLYVLIWCSLI